ncbi:PREDICTED: glypican-2 [Galeopterus variegatus]|uniref:Glypican-2 n=1 Tax=Galeopterus variegatus TaxID=482537 RepID=A0ABM0S6W9_GALVR|nr:PREDICTED: glypican-2 [Galeopterus variegatus]
MSALRPLLLLLLPLCPGPGPGPRSEAKVTRSCAETREVLRSRGYSLNQIPPALISGEHLQVCTQEYTCCSSETEQRLTREAEATFQGLVENSGSFLVHTLAAGHRKFDEFFREMLLVSQHSLTQLFSHSYGRLYAQHKLIFNGLFAQLRDYYGVSGEGLEDILADFWAQLLERVFPLLHPQYNFSPDYLLCLSRLASTADGSLRPFGDSPHRLRVQITRALVGARAFVQGLETGRIMVSEALKVEVSQSCSQALMRLIGCPFCQGVPSLLPCWGFCLDVVRGCLSNKGLEPEWSSYLDGILLLAEKLQGPFSYELAAESIGVKVSEGLKHLQENNAKFSAQVFQECGTPHLVPARNRRALAPPEAAGRLYLAPALGGTLTEMQQNPDLETEESEADFETRRRLLHLRAATARMRAAAFGSDLENQEAEEDASGSGGGQHYADDWMAGAAAVPPPAQPPRSPRLPRPPRRDSSGVRAGGGGARYSQGRSRSRGVSIGFHTQPILILPLSVLALLGPR